ncbi:hypothetical protein [Nocardiopsis coralliicola]
MATRYSGPVTLHCDSGKHIDADAELAAEPGGIAWSGTVTFRDRMDAFTAVQDDEWDMTLDDEFRTPCRATPAETDIPETAIPIQGRGSPPWSASA